MAISTLKKFAFLSKTVPFAIIILVGVASGILIGYKLIGEKKVSASNVIGDEGVPEERKLHFGAGDSFPSVEYLSIDAKSGKSKELIQGKRSGVIFAEQS